MTIEEAKQQLRDNWEQGLDCPCCGQFVKLYNRKLHTVMALMLIKLYKLGEGYHHIRDFIVTPTGTNDFSKLRYWGLVAEMPKDESDSSKRTSGFWAVTTKGTDFVHGKQSVPSHVQLFNSKKYGFTGDQITIREALGNEFNYQELMATDDPQSKLFDIPKVGRHDT